MKKNMLLVPFLAVLTLMIVGFASASLFSISEVEVDDTIVSSSGNTGFFAGEMVPVRVWFTADTDQEDVGIEVEFRGYDKTESVSQDFGSVEAGTEYHSKIFKLKIPNDVDEKSEETTLYVTISSRERDSSVTKTYSLKLQRESDELNVLSVDYSSQVSAGDIIPISVVVKNSGYRFAPDNYVVVSIPSLSISTRGYIGDLDSIENYDHDNHEEDSIQNTVYLKIPADAQTSVYELEVAVYNDDTETVVTKLISVEGKEVIDSDVVVPLEGKDGEEVSTSVVALTVVLVIIFIVLLAVLVVLLTKKEKPIDEVETSYY